MTNRKFFPSILLAGIIGGIVSISGMRYFTSKKINAESALYNAKQVSYNDIANNFNLTDAAENGVKAVVHIAAAESEAKTKSRLKNYRRQFPFGGYFGFDNGYYGMRGGGSGVIFSSDGYIVTNNHVVDFADDIVVTLSDNREYKAKKIGTDPSTDIAVLKIEEHDLPTLLIADSDKARLGQWVLAIGNPYDSLTSSVTAGIISAKGRNLNLISDERALEEFLQTDAAVNPGNSGGALIDADGKLLGITTAIASPTGSYAGYAFAVPSNLMKKVADKIIEKGGDLNVKPSLGISGATVDKDIQKEYNLKVNSGVYVVEVMEGSAAKSAGLQAEDVIVKINDTEINKFEDLSKIINLANIGDKLKVFAYRGNNIRSFDVILKQSL